jgi:hypothetical protein
MLALYIKAASFLEGGEVSEKEAKKTLGVDDLEFDSAFNITDAIAGEVAQMKINKKGETDETSAYGATLARNACHFAPESWHSWTSYHEKGRAAALESWSLKKQAEAAQLKELANPQGPQAAKKSLSWWERMLGKKQETPQKESEVLFQKADTKANEALLNNGFGDHYLQDSYAAGHLINKTQIMQFFVQYLDKNPDKWTYTTDSTWRQMQNMAYGQGDMTSGDQYDKTKVGSRKINKVEVSTAKNPQLVENTKEMNNPDFGWEQRFEMLGLKTPPSVTAGSPALKLMLFLQEKSGYLSTWTYAELAGKMDKIGLTDAELRKAISDLFVDHVLFVTDADRYSQAKVHGGATGKLGSEAKIELRKEYIVSVTGDNSKKFKAAAASARKGNMKGYNKMMQATVYKDYVKFMRDSFLQKSTNKLHDHFCEKGLDVQDAKGTGVMHIYGDSHMLDKGAGKGVKESAETSNMSRDSILDIVKDGVEKPAQSTQEILKRLPAQVTLPGTGAISLADWHNKGKLQAFCESDIFPQLDTYQELAAGTLGSGGLGKITKDEDIHSGEAF